VKEYNGDDVGIFVLLRISFVGFHCFGGIVVVLGISVGVWESFLITV